MTETQPAVQYIMQVNTEQQEVVSKPGAAKIVTLLYFLLESFTIRLLWYIIV